MRKISLKSVLLAVFYLLTAMALSACIFNPVDIAKYVNDDSVIGIIVRKVALLTEENWGGPPSDDGLIAENGRISGLNPDKYYIIAEYVIEITEEDVTDEDVTDEEDEPEDSNVPSAQTELENVQFVKSDGTRSSRLSNIGKVTGRTITGLTNGRWHNGELHYDRAYLVKSAVPLERGITSYTSPTEENSTEQIITDGEITLSAQDRYLEFSQEKSSISTYTIVKVPISPRGTTSLVTVPRYRIALEGEGTETDYIFVQNIMDDIDIILDTFRFLKVKIPVSTAITITVDLSFTGDNSPELAPTPLSYPQNSVTPITINVTNAAIFGAANIKWYMDGVSIGTGASFIIDLNNDAVQYRLIGVYTITVEAVMGSIPYSATIEITVLSP